MGLVLRLLLLLVLALGSLSTSTRATAAPYGLPPLPYALDEAQLAAGRERVPDPHLEARPRRAGQRDVDRRARRVPVGVGQRLMDHLIDHAPGRRRKRGPVPLGEPVAHGHDRARVPALPDQPRQPLQAGRRIPALVLPEGMHDGAQLGEPGARRRPDLLRGLDHVRKHQLHPLCDLFRAREIHGAEEQVADQGLKVRRARQQIAHLGAGLAVIQRSHQLKRLLHAFQVGGELGLELFVEHGGVL